MRLMRSNNEFFESTTTLSEIKRIKPLTGLKIVEKLNFLELNDVETIKEYWVRKKPEILPFLFYIMTVYDFISVNFRINLKRFHVIVL